MSFSDVQLGPFRLLEPVAAGGMGVVYKAEHREQGVPVAIKLLTRAGARSPTFLEDFHNEVRAAASLDHPAIVSVLDHGLAPEDIGAHIDGVPSSSPWLAMEFVPSGTLKHSAWRNNWRSVREVMLGVLDGLAHAHARGVVHRDVKVANVMVRESPQLTGNPWRVQLTDFGIAAALDAAPKVEGAEGAGTPSYMAPEQFVGGWRDQGPWTDLYAVGCLAWSGITGRTPFRGNMMALAHAHLSRPLPKLEPLWPVPEGTEDWLRRLLEKDPAQRYRHAADAAWALLALGDAPDDGEDDETLIRVERGRVAENTTLIFDTREVASVVGKVVTGTAAVHAVPPIPSSWRRPDRRPDLGLIGVGLGVYGLRAVPMVGREAERDQLWSALRKAHANPGALALVVRGPAGVGKSKLVHWIAERAIEVGAATVVRVEADANGGPGHALTQLVQRALRTAGLHGDELTEHIEARLVSFGREDHWEATALAEIVEPTGRVSFGKPAEKWAVARRLIQDLAADRPALLVLDDAVLDPELLDFVEWLLQRGTESSVLIAMAARDEHLAERKAQAAKLLTLDVHTQLVGPLDEAERRELVRELLGLTGQLAARVEARSAGNPMFAVEIIAEWVRTGVLQATKRGFALAPGAKAELPDSLYEVWAKRTRELAKQLGRARMALFTAVGIGLEVDARLWHASCQAFEPPLAADDLRKVARVLRDAQLIDLEESGFRFRQPMFVESVRRLVREAGGWPMANEAIARALEHFDVPYKDERMGLHLVAAGHHERAFAPTLAGIAKRRGDGESRLSMAHIQQRLIPLMHEAGIPESDPRWGEVVLIRQRTHALLCDYDAAGVDAQLLVDNAQALGWKTESVGYRALAVNNLRLGDATTSLAMLDKAIASAEATQDMPALAGALRWRGEIAWDIGHHKAEQYALEALPLIEEHLDPLNVGHSLITAASMYRRRGEYVEARRCFERARELFEQAHSRKSLLHAVFAEGILLAQQKNYDDSDACYREALEHAVATEGMLAQGYCLEGLADNQRRRGNLDAAEQGIRDVLAYYARTNQTDVFTTQLTLAQIQLARGDAASAAATIMEVQAELDPARIGWMAYTYALLACTVNGRACIRHAKRALEGFEETKFIEPELLDALTPTIARKREEGRVEEADALQAIWDFLDRNMKGGAEH